MFSLKKRDQITGVGGEAARSKGRSLFFWAQFTAEKENAEKEKIAQKNCEQEAANRIENYKVAAGLGSTQKFFFLICFEFWKLLKNFSTFLKRHLWKCQISCFQ